MTTTLDLLLHVISCPICGPVTFASTSLVLAVVLGRRLRRARRATRRHADPARE